MSQSPDTVICRNDALLEEYAAIFCDDWTGGRPPPRTREWLRANETELRATAKTALCLSGGGIRSAAFCLGALQALAAKGLLGEFNYLSTVSGGGYIGAWLETIMHGGGKGNGALSAANKALTKPTDTALRSLRNYTNFLIPEGGFGSSDTWSAIVLWLRNVLLNWLVFGPVLLAVAIVPLLYRGLLWDVSPTWGVIALIAGYAGLLGGTIMVCRSVPTHAYGAKDPKTGLYGVAASTVQRWIVAPILAWAFLAPLWFSMVSAGRYDAAPFLSWTFAPISLGAFAALMAGYVIAALTLGRSHWAAFAWNIGFWGIGAALSAFLLQLGATLGQQMPATTLAVLGPLWVIGAQVLHSTLYVGLRWSAAYAELDREWLARLNGEKLIPMLVWSVLAAITLILPVLVFEQWPTTYSTVVGIASGPIGAWLGRSAKSSFGETSADATAASPWAAMMREAAIAIATLLFAVTLFMLLGWLGGIIVEQLGTLLEERAWLDHPWLLALVVIVVLVLVSAYCGARININRFSLHGVYRNRLARAFIGTARPPEQREPDAYTRFDPGDNVRMQDLYQGKEQRGILFPVVNVTLNLLEGAPSGWAERKAAPFTITPLRAGAACLGDKDEHGDPEGRYVRTADYGGQEHESGHGDEKSGITLGTAMTISGAAVSPSMGYHSSPATSFLMTLFDVRLGAWLPNPGVTQRWTPAKPSNALRPLFNEMLGRANDKRSDVYLSDGGHFDNLGVYEMLRRRCRIIVAIDTGSDPEYKYLDLGNALRLATIDFDINVRFVAPIIKGKRDLDAAGAYARIIYPDAPDGHLLYLKPWLPQALPADVLAYFSAHADFPHQTTANQFFSESQFESYRALGELIVSNAFGGANKLDDMVVAAERAAARQYAATAATAPRWQRKPPRSTPPRRE
jgi:predicted acylesterase/phospholipase RssA